MELHWDSASIPMQAQYTTQTIANIFIVTNQTWFLLIEYQDEMDTLDFAINSNQVRSFSITTPTALK